jgi:hypothetical protein
MHMLSQPLTRPFDKELFHGHLHPFERAGGASGDEKLEWLLYPTATECRTRAPTAQQGLINVVVQNEAEPILVKPA